MEDKKIFGVTSPKIIYYGDKLYVQKNDFKDRYYNYDVNFSEYITYFLLRKLKIDVPNTEVVSINNQNYNLIEYIPNTIEYRALNDIQKNTLIQSLKSKLILLIAVNLIVGNNDIHRNNFLVSNDIQRLYPIDFSDTFLSKIDSNIDDANIQDQVYKRVSCTLFNEMLSLSKLDNSDFEKAKDAINSISIDEFYREVENVNVLFRKNLSNDKKMKILDRFIDANAYIDEISYIYKAMSNQKNK